MEKITLLGLLKTALVPVGKTMYVWGGGWNEEDSGAGDETVHLGCSPRWALFANRQQEDYDFHNTKYQIHDGLDCSGYVGWVLYNVFETENGQEGYVTSAETMGRSLSERGLGTYCKKDLVGDFLAGDIMTTAGHVYITLGQCGDQSLLLVHASPPGVQICGTDTPKGGKKSEAVELAEDFMACYAPQWYEKFHDYSRNDSYLKDYDQFRFYDWVLPDPEGIRQMDGQKVLEKLKEGMIK